MTLAPDSRPRPLVIGLGNEYRSDDGVGLAVVRRLREIDGMGDADLEEARREPMTLMDRWSGRDLVIVVDAVVSGLEPGAMHVLTVGSEPLPAEIFGQVSTHGFSIGEAVELGRQLGNLPARVTIYGVEAESLRVGDGLTSAVSRSVDGVARAIASKLEFDCPHHPSEAPRETTDGAEGVGAGHA